MLIVYGKEHDAHHCLELDCGELIRSWDSPERAQNVFNSLTREGHAVVAAQALPHEILLKVHDADYIAFLQDAWKLWVEEGHKASAAFALAWRARSWNRPDRVPTCITGKLGYYSIGVDCSIIEHTWTAAEAAAASAATAASVVAKMKGHGSRSDTHSKLPRAAFAICRPPGHHAMRNAFGGYCYLNNAAVAAQTLLSSAFASRVFVLDVDYHHGNGTQDIFYSRSDVCYASLHADPATEFPYFSGYADEIGEGDGQGYTRNVPLPPGTTFDVWSEHLESCFDWAKEKNCGAMVVSLGLDTYIRDPVSTFKFEKQDYSALGKRLRTVDLPTVFVLEGGYDLPSIGENVVTVIHGFEEDIRCK